MGGRSLSVAPRTFHRFERAMSEEEDIADIDDEDDLLARTARWRSERNASGCPRAIRKSQRTSTRQSYRGGGKAVREALKDSLAVDMTFLERKLPTRSPA